MPGSKNYSILKGLEWLNFYIASEFEKFREFQVEQKKKQLNPFVVPIFAAVISYSVSRQYCLEDIIRNAFVFLVIYHGVNFLMYLRGYLTRYCRQMKGVSTEFSPEFIAQKVKKFDFTICNQVLLAYGFLEKARESIAELENPAGNTIAKPCIINFYLLECIHYIKDPLIEIDELTCPENKISEKIIEYIDKNTDNATIKDYRLLSIMKLIKEILELYTNISTDCKINSFLLTNNELFQKDLSEIQSRYNNIMGRFEKNE